MKAEFDDIVRRVKNTSLKKSYNRTKRTAIALFFTKMRLGLSHRVLATLFSIGSVRMTSRIFHQAREALLKDFVPHFMGVGHITRQKVIVSISFTFTVLMVEES